MLCNFVQLWLSAVNCLNAQMHLVQLLHMAQLLSYDVCARHIPCESITQLQGTMTIVASTSRDRHRLVASGLLCADTELWDVLAITDDADIRPFVLPVLEANGEMPIPNQDTLRPLMFKAAEGINWSTRLDNPATHKILAGVAQWIAYCCT